MSAANALDAGRRIVCLLLGVALILAYDSIGHLYYKSFATPAGNSMYHVPVEELAHVAFFTFLGTAVVVLLALAVSGTPAAARLLALARPLAGRRALPPLMAAALVLASSYAVARGVLGHAVTTDDEHAYRFIAQTLRTGALTAPSPGTDLEFFREQFVVLNEHARYGKYPIGHPLLLAVGQALGLEALAGPLITASLAFPLAWVGRMIYGPAVAALGLLLFATSPQMLLTGATYLSQPTSALCMLLALGCLLRSRDGRPLAWLALAGTALGYGALTRPLPGVLFAAAAFPWVAARAVKSGRWSCLVAFALPLGLAAAAFLAINRVQTGGWLVTAYEAFHTPGRSIARTLGGDLATLAMSVSASLLRLNVWLLGWPVSLAFCLFARRAPGLGLVHALLGAALAYRLVAPKAGVAGTGPVYMFEAAPLLCLLAAAGLAHLAQARPRLGRWDVDAPSLAAVVTAATLVNVTMFLPVKLQDLRAMGRAQSAVTRLLAEQGIHQAVVFHQSVVPFWTSQSWAEDPRSNSPAFDDDVVFLRFQPEDPERNIEVGRRRFPGRSLWYFGYVDGQPRLVPLERLLAHGPGAATADPPRPPSAP
jgi:hypothetical protein